MMSKRLIPLAALEQIFKKSGAERVSGRAKEQMKSVVEDYAQQIATQAIRLAKHAKRKTIKASDIKLAAKQF